MKKLLFIFSLITLMGYGCNRSEDNREMGMQKEEERGVNDFGEVTGSGSEMNRDLERQEMNEDAMDRENRAVE